MKAAQISEYGDPSIIEIHEVAVPIASVGQILVEVHASSLNPFDSAVRAGHMKDTISLEFPTTLGGDIAGVVIAVGSGVSGYMKGDKVYGQAYVVAGDSGAFAEIAAVKAGHIAIMPSNLDFQQAAVMPLVGVSALQALTDHIGLRPGQRIFIHGGAGGIGTVAIQIAKHVGAHIATTSSGANIEYVKDLGADVVIDYNSQDYTDALQDFDAVFDTVGGGDFTKSLTVLKPGGIAVSMIAPADSAKAAERGVTAMTQSTRVTTAKLDSLRELIEQGVVTSHIDRVYLLEDIRAAFLARESGTVRGKVAIAIM